MSSKGSPTKPNAVTTGPAYRATQLWNDVIKALRSDIPRGRHRRYMKSYDDCFNASNAIDWLHDYLQNNPNFGTHITRANAIQLLCKLQKARIIEDVRGSKYREDFADNGRLFRFTLGSPSKKLPPPPTNSRKPLSARSDVLNTPSPTDTKLATKPPKPPLKSIISKSHSLSFGSKSNINKLKEKEEKKEECKESQEQQPLPQIHLVKPQITLLDIEDTWKSHTLDRLRSILHLSSLADILDVDCVHAQYIIHNMTHVNRNGLVTDIDKSEQLPQWILSAMKCLAHWPERIEEGLSYYPGFEKDVFMVVKSYFEALSDPLTTYAMYEVIANVFVCAEAHSLAHRSSFDNVSSSGSTPGSRMTSFASVENLMMNLTMCGANELSEPILRPYQDNLQLERKESVLKPPGILRNKHDIMQRVTHSQNVYGHDDSSGNGRISPKFQTDEDSPPFSQSLRARGERVPAGLHRSLSQNCRGVLTRQRSYAHMETSFSVDGNEPHTRVYPQDNPAYTNSCQSVPSSHQSKGSIHNQYHSMWNVESVLPNTKCRSMTDVSRVDPAPENELSKYDDLRNQVERFIDESDGDEQVNASLVRSTSVHHRRSSVPERKETRRLSGGRSYDYVRSDHAYCEPLSQKAPCDLSRAVTMKIQTESSGRANGQDPPPYVPPPSYLTSCRRPDSSAFSDTQSVRSESIRSVRSSNSSRRSFSPRETSDSAYLSTRSSVTRKLSSSNSSGRLARTESSPCLFAPASEDRMVDALQIICLLLPPANRRKLHLLLRLMWRMANNDQLTLSRHLDIRSKVLDTFTHTIMRAGDSTEYDETLSQRIVSFLMDHHQEILCVPGDLKVQIEERLRQRRQTQVKYLVDDPTSLAYCEQVSQAEYEKQCLSSSQRALVDLLDNIANNTKMPPKEKKKKLKQFKESHPEVYNHRFPGSQSETDLSKPRLKQPLLKKPLQKLRSMRL